MVVAIVISDGIYPRDLTSFITDKEWDIIIYKTVFGYETNTLPSYVNGFLQKEKIIKEMAGNNKIHLKIEFRFVVWWNETKCRIYRIPMKPQWITHFKYI
jgi:hypothetical protein